MSPLCWAMCACLGSPPRWGPPGLLRSGLRCLPLGRNVILSTTRRQTLHPLDPCPPTLQPRKDSGRQERLMKRGGVSAGRPSTLRLNVGLRGLKPWQRGQEGRSGASGEGSAPHKRSRESCGAGWGALSKPERRRPGDREAASPWSI